MITLEELDNHKKGMSEVARNARQVSRSLDALVADVSEGAIDSGIPLSKLGNKDAGGRLYFQTKLQNWALPEGLPEGKADNQILGVVRALQSQQAFDRARTTAGHDDAQWLCCSTQLRQRVRREQHAKPELARMCGPLVNAHRPSGALQRHTSGQSANAGADDESSACHGQSGEYTWPRKEEGRLLRWLRHEHQQYLHHHDKAQFYAEYSRVFEKN